MRKRVPNTNCKKRAYLSTPGKSCWLCNAGTSRLSTTCFNAGCTRIIVMMKGVLR